MWKRTAFLFAAFLLNGACCSQTFKSVGSGTAPKDSPAIAPEKRTYTPDFFDSLNQGREMTLSPSDFVGQPMTVQGSGEADSVAFQVQITATNSREIAQKEKSRIEDALQVPVEIVFEEPYYKLRSRRFTDKQDAEKFKEKMMEIGQAKAWIVRVKK